jgi:hypothetical protein
LGTSSSRTQPARTHGQPVRRPPCCARAGNGLPVSNQ